MTFAFKIKETPKSKGLIAHLQSLAYVEPLNQDSPPVLSQKEMIAAIRRAEKSKSIPLVEAMKQSEQWRRKRNNHVESFQNYMSASNAIKIKNPTRLKNRNSF